MSRSGGPGFQPSGSGHSTPSGIQAIAISGECLEDTADRDGRVVEGPVGTEEQALAQAGVTHCAAMNFISQTPAEMIEQMAFFKETVIDAYEGT